MENTEKRKIRALLLTILKDLEPGSEAWRNCCKEIAAIDSKKE